MISNLAFKFLSESGRSFDDYDGVCHIFVDHFARWLTKNEIKFKKIWLYCPNDSLITKNGEKSWWFHAVVIINNKVHDLWHDRVLLLEKYIESMFLNFEKVRFFRYKKSYKKQFKAYDEWSMSLTRAFVVRDGIPVYEFNSSVSSLRTFHG